MMRESQLLLVKKKMTFLNIVSDTNKAEQDIAFCIDALVPDGCHHRKALPCADYILETNEVCLLLERKTMNDFCASIADNRLDDQIDRMLAVAKEQNSQQNRVKTSVALLLCGYPPHGEFAGTTGMKTSSFYGKLFHLQLNHHITVFWCSLGAEEIAKRIVQIGKQMVIQLEGDSQVSNSLVNSMVQCGKRKRSIEKDNVHETTKAMLLGIPGMSAHVCNKLVERYSTLSKLRKLTEKEMAVIELGTDGKRRKLGPVLARRIAGVLRA